MLTNVLKAQGNNGALFSTTTTCRLLEHCRKHKYLSSSGEVFALLVSSLLENLLDYRTIIMQDESKENRMSCTVNVLVGAHPGLATGCGLLTLLPLAQY